MKRVAIFASGSGTNAEAIIQSQKAGQLPCEVALLITDKPGAKVVERVKVHEIPVCALDPKTYPSKEAYEIEVVQQLKEKQIDFVVLAGYMRLVGPTLLGAYEGRIVNIHPSLLPAFPGLHAIEQAIRANVKVTGVTIHYVDEGMDTGPIIAQEAVSIEEEDTLETLTTKIQAVEHRLYPATLHKLLSK
ncbi:phosphoribosylglycinamide formyltransferase [Halalkalibacterium halodurans]|uniref:Phosphoribosylglycinamide formyltransferase n=1 Tax=Halalkalibacterium halodurans (strain ATCC BAA-125 / DSM 18197 / FERM 7344 / JCM 9153 / C-125) TaxID=272558 RepID=Q9KF54_HALH5|nr:phosphoribosylglycinamide formyltransferase [Halalkalibacterium halodurans]MED3647580.1 phosphoribosylglycinamide formyltransferase [Halalkalibacterium halodurans]MED4123606.1 phosphoribosylglycinamide formyltransferase [Halalkalibacterium halodurans]TES52163.1 phosphoribosylglycinamide formyltransferase [Halalkalibacterium halodurans]BAB04351.1 phosphoribosylglycinamide formyltransferase [Halalkalibacterium halodurans C-125]